MALSSRINGSSILGRFMALLGINVATVTAPSTTPIRASQGRIATAYVRSNFNVSVARFNFFLC